MSQDRLQRTESCPDSEELAALLDGDVAAAERKRLMQHVEACAHCFEVFTETARYQLQASGASSDGASVVAFGEPAHRSRAHNWRAWAFAAAAGLSILLVGLLLWLALPQAARVGSGEVTQQASTGVQLDLQQLWPEIELRRVEVFQPPAVAGFAPTTVSEPQRAFRRGVYRMDLEVAARLDDVAAAANALERLQRVTDAEQARVLDAVREKLETTTEVPSLEGVFRLQPSMDEERFGRWAELGRLAAGARASAPLTNPAFRRTLDDWLGQIADGGTGATPLATELQRIADQLAVAPAQRADFRQLEKSFETILFLGGFTG